MILCDGGCNRAYHARCTVPPTDPTLLDPDDGWLCPACEVKADVLRAINAEFGYEYEQETGWEEVFAGPPPAPSWDPSPRGAGPRLPSAGDGGGGPLAPGAASGAALLAGPELGASDGDDDDAPFVPPSSPSSDGDRSDPSSSSSSEDDGGGPSSAVAASPASGASAPRPGARPRSAKRRRRGARIDYAALNASIFGDYEAYEGEGEDSVDRDWSVGQSPASPGSRPGTAGGRGRGRGPGPSPPGAGPPGSGAGPSVAP